MARPLANIALGLPRVAAMIASLVVCACGMARAQDVFDAAAKREVLDELQTTLLHKAYVGGVRFSDWADHETKYFDRLDRADSPEAFAGVVNRALAEFGVSHAALVPPSAFKQMERTEVVGIGVSVRLANDGLRVIRVMPDSPAAGASIAPGDIIIEIDGQRPKDPEDLEGEPDSVAKIRLRKLNGERIEVEVPRKRIQTRTPATLTILDANGATVAPDAPGAVSPEAAPGEPPHFPIRNYGLLRLPTFAQEYDEDEIKGLFTRCMDLSGLIIDLRGNGGGAVHYMQHFLSFMIIEETPIGVAVSGEMAARYVEATGGDPSDVIKVAAWSTDKLKVTSSPIRPFPRPIVVLLNGGSASASELSAQALRELRGAKVGGRTSAGALLVSQFFPLPHDFKVQVPISDYVSIQGFRPEGVGVVPDLPRVRRAKRAGVDPDVDGALDALVNWLTTHDSASPAVPSTPAEADETP